MTWIWNHIVIIGLGWAFLIAVFCYFWHGLMKLNDYDRDMPDLEDVNNS